MNQSVFKTLLIVFSVLLIVFHGWSQSPQSAFLEAKRLYRNGDYRSAGDAFSTLFADQNLGPYAIFYAALSAYRDDKPKEAASIWRQLLLRHPDWSEIKEVYYWLIVCSYELEDYALALQYSDSLAGKSGEAMAGSLAKAYLPQAAKPVLIELSEAFPGNREAALALAPKIDLNNEEEASLLTRLVSKYDLDISEYASPETPTVKKNKYNIAVLFPFMFEGISQATKTADNKVIMDLYQGMLLAEEELNAEGERIVLNPFDTKKKAEAVEAVLADPNLLQADLIVGPLYAGPIEKAAKFARRNRINMFNPVSSNGAVIAGNPFSFLIKPSFSTIASDLAEHSINTFSNKNALIYYETDKDASFASVYKEKIEAAGFRVLEYERVDHARSKDILDILTAQHKRYLFSIRQADSLSAMPGRFIHEIPLAKADKKERKFALGRENEEGEPADSLIYYEMKHDVADDSIGHILVASRDNVIVNNFIGALENRSDSIGLLGYGSWLNFRTLDFDQLERLKVALADTDYVNQQKPKYRGLYELIKNRCHCVPADYHFLGYETVKFLGSMLIKYGKYFQSGFLKEGFTEGEVMSGFEYGWHNDNQVTPIVTIRDNHLVPYYSIDGQE